MPMQNGSRASAPGPLRAVAVGETARRTIDDLRREQSQLEVDDRVNLRGRGRRALRVARNRLHHLADETVANETGLRLAAVPHHRTQEFQVRRRQRPAVHRRRRERRAAPIGIVHADDAELRAGGDLKRDANQSLCQQEAEGSPPCPDGRDVGAFAVGAVVGAEDRVEPVGAVETVVQLRGRDRPSLRGAVTRHAAPSVRPELLEEGVLGLGPVRADDREDAARIGERPLTRASRRGRRGPCRRDQ